MSRHVLVAVALFASTLGCRSTVAETFELPAWKRSYRVSKRKDHDAKRPAPVLIALHAYATQPGVIDDAMDMEQVAVAERGFILVTPRGGNDRQGNPFWNATRACCDGDRRAPDDLGYLRAVLEDVRRRYALDSRRIYAVGVSNGAFMAHRWACDPGGDLAGIIAISGVGPSPEDPPCRPARGVSVVQIHGDDDETVRYAGGRMNDAEHPSVAASVGAWALLDGCSADATPARAAWSKFGLSIEAETHVCPKATVTSWRVLGGKHNLRLRKAPFTSALELVDGHPPP